jgi:hypothetical protein
MWLAWQPAMVLACVAAFVGLALRGAPDRRWSSGAAFAREIALVLVLYSIWQILGSLGTVREATGFTNGRRLYDIESTLHIANEATIESWVLPHRLWIQTCNAYYAIAHAPALIVFLVWLFVRHRDRYPRMRNLIALSTGICLCIHFIPVAPPRLYPELGFVDSAKLYGQSVYGTIGHGLSDQMSAMPSIHMAWAVIVAVGAVTISSSPWRWIAVVHGAMTALVITATANHWWLDSIVALAIVAAVYALQLATAAVRRSFRTPPASARAPVAV